MRAEIMIPCATEDNTLRDYMEVCEPVKAGRSYTNKLPAKVIRLAFYGMFRKTPSDNTDSKPGCMFIQL